jgi:hypothetical protein
VGLDVGAVFAARGNTFEAFERIEVMVAWGLFSTGSERSSIKAPCCVVKKGNSVVADLLCWDPLSV